MLCLRCNINKDVEEFDHGKEDSICEQCCGEMLLGGGTDHVTMMESYWDFEKGDYKK